VQFGLAPFIIDIRAVLGGLMEVELFEVVKLPLLADDNLPML
jgi:hypothetical protein